MFFIMAISSGQKQAEYNATHICNRCGRYGRYEVFMTYTYLSLFFIPILKWGRQYYARTTCCQSLYHLNSETGKDIFRQTGTEIKESDLEFIESGNSHYQSSKKCCPGCGYEAQNDYDFCPKCGQRL